MGEKKCEKKKKVDLHAGGVACAVILRVQEVLRKKRKSLPKVGGSGGSFRVFLMKKKKGR